MIKRFIFNRLENEIEQPEVNILLGARQVGKTTLLEELEKHAGKAGLKTAFFDLEQPQMLASFNRSDQEIIEIIKSAGQVVLIDEFQYIQNASKIFKAIYDSRRHTKVKLVASGSSSLEIHKHLEESLAGRRFIIHIYPLSLSELKSADPKFSLTTYLQYGGMPALTHTDSEERKQLILAELLSAYILKDIKSLVKEENIRAFNHLMYLLAENQGSVISVQSLAGDIKMSPVSVSRYLDILEQTFVNFSVPSFSNNLGNELKKSVKTYFYDLGMRNVILKDFSLPEERKDKGVLFESFVFLKLKAMLLPNMEIKFWRTKDGSEVDFILVKNRKPIPIEVKAECPAPEIPKGVRNFLNRYPDTKQAFVINRNLSATVTYEKISVHFITFDAFERGEGFVI